MAVSRNKELARIRRASMQASRDLRDYLRALTALRQRLIRAIQQEAPSVRKTMAARFQRMGLYADERGVLRRIAPFGAKHRKRKQRLGLDSRRGIMRKGVLKTLQSPRVIIKTAHGFVLDLFAPDITVTGRATLGKRQRNIAGKRIMAGEGKHRKVVGMGVKRQKTTRQSFRVNNYLDHFAKQKARGLGSLATDDVKRLDRAALEAWEKHFDNIMAGARAKLSQADLIKLNIILTRKRPEA